MSLLARILEATPPPPIGDDVDALLDAFERMQAVRAALLTTTDPGAYDPALGAQLAAREAAWEAALVRARNSIGAIRIGASQARRYLHQGAVNLDDNPGER